MQWFNGKSLIKAVSASHLRLLATLLQSLNGLDCDSSVVQ
jgi:hypothetical protein